jgi:hypothetical protein
LDCKFSLYLTGHSDLIECIFPLSWSGHPTFEY